MEELEKISAEPEKFIERYYRSIEAMVDNKVYDYLVSNRIPYMMEKQLFDIGGQMQIQKLEFARAAESAENFRIILQLENAAGKTIKEIELYGQIREDAGKITSLYFYNLKDLKFPAE